MANQSTNQGRGFAAMPQSKRRTIAKKGESHAKRNNPGTFANDREKARRAGAEGGPK